MAKGLFAKKSVKALMEDAADARHGLKRHLGPFNLTMMGIGAIVGAGIFVLTGQASAEYAGPAIIFSFIFAGLICVFSALCYAELASLIPISGSAYTYAYVAMGEFVAWVIGWGLTLEYLFSASTVAVGWSGYFTSLLKDFGLNFPTHWCNAPFHWIEGQGWGLTGAIINVPAMFIVAFLGMMIAIGIKAAASFNNIMVAVKMLVIVLFVAVCAGYINTDNWHPFIPDNTGIFGQFGWSGIFRGAGVVFFAFIGFDALSTLAQEARNPQKDLPIGMLASLGVSTIAYIIIALVLTGVVSFKMLGVPDPMAVAVNALGPAFLWLRLIIKIAILAGLTTVTLVMMMGQTRIFYTMSQDGLMPPVFGKIHPKLRTPFVNTLIVTFFGALVSGLFPVVLLGQLVSMGTLLAFAIVCFGVLVLRYTQPLLHRSFKVPFVPWIPLAGTLICIFQMVLLPLVTWVQLLVWMAIGIAIYFCYGRHHSKVNKVKR